MKMKRLEAETAGLREERDRMNEAVRQKELEAEQNREALAQRVCFTSRVNI